jgi:hypothetical protein
MKSFAVFAVIGAAVTPAFAQTFFAGDTRFYIRGVAYQPGLFAY